MVKYGNNRFTNKLLEIAPSPLPPPHPHFLSLSSRCVPFVRIRIECSVQEVAKKLNHGDWSSRKLFSVTLLNYVKFYLIRIIEHAYFIEM